MRRREFLSLLSTSTFVALPLQAAPASIAAAWRGGRQARVGLLSADSGRYTPQAALEVPTRAHGLAWACDGSLLAVARRPGEWLQRQSRDGRLLARQWAEPDRSFNGHLLVAADGQHVFSTETAQDRDRGLLVRRVHNTLQPLDEWTTGGRDPHELLQDERGDLWVANGGIAASAETGRMRIPRAGMDSSLAWLDGRHGGIRGQWRLADANLSMRHMAWGPRDPSSGRHLLGIALQAEHETPTLRQGAPLLALFDGQQLRACANPPLAGYGGDIAWTGSQWCVSATRADSLAFWHADGRWAGVQQLGGAGALAVRNGQLLAGGRETLRPGLTLDNHWLADAAGIQIRTQETT